MSSDPAPRGAIRFEAVTKRYAASRLRGGRAGPEDHPGERVALDGVDLCVEPGERVGLIGPNGAGKSTVLRLVAGITSPSSGHVAAGGSIRPLLELGVGFHPLLTGRENARLTLRLLGAPARRIDVDECAEFAGLSSRIDAPVRTYSAGMRARLGFAVASRGEMDILLADEILSVGDLDFQNRCIERISELVDQGTTLVFVSHELPLVSQLCTRAIWLERGGVRDAGPAREVIRRYLQGTPTRVRAGAHSPLAFGEVSLGPPVLDPWGRLQVDAEVDVRTSIGPPRLRIDLLIPDLAPDQVFSSTTTRLSSLSRRGRYRVRGTSNPFPGEASRIEMVASLISADGLVCDTCSQDVRITGGRGHGKPHLAAVPVAELLPVASDDDDGRLSEPPKDADHLSVPPDGGPAVVADHVTKWYRRGRLNRVRRKMFPGEHPAVDDVSAAFVGGSVTGLIGSNGAGKTTLLRLFAGVTEPDSGTVTTIGRVIPMLELGIGFSPNLTGRENVLVSGRLLGLRADEVRRRFDRIQEHFGMEGAFDIPVRMYSSGMRARLGFALAIAAEADVLLVDEVLSVGDEAFRRQAVARIRSARDAGTAIVLVSHELRLVEMVADDVARLEAGRIVDVGEPSDVIGRYGGASWSAGVKDAGGVVRVGAVRVQQSVVGLGDDIEFEAMLRVERPAPQVRIEVAYRVIPEDRDEPMDDQTRLDLTFLQARLDLGEAPFDRAGRYRLRGRVSDNVVQGTFDLVISAIDVVEGEVLSESWHQVIVGVARPMPGPVLEFDWVSRPVERAAGV